jgi:hypothetical protein
MVIFIVEKTYHNKRNGRTIPTHVIDNRGFKTLSDAQQFIMQQPDYNAHKGIINETTHEGKEAFYFIQDITIYQD